MKENRIKQTNDRFPYLLLWLSNNIVSLSVFLETAICRSILTWKTYGNMNFAPHYFSLFLDIAPCLSSSPLISWALFPSPPWLWPPSSSLSRRVLLRRSTTLLGGASSTFKESSSSSILCFVLPCRGKNSVSTVPSGRWYRTCQRGKNCDDQKSDFRFVFWFWFMFLVGCR